MSGASHTPGPLLIEDGGGRIMITHVAGMNIARMESQRDRETALAFAHLFVAAPDLLEALKEAAAVLVAICAARGRIEDQGEPSPVDMEIMQARVTLHRAQLALAKAQPPEALDRLGGK